MNVFMERIKRRPKLYASLGLGLAGIVAFAIPSTMEASKDLTRTNADETIINAYGDQLIAGSATNTDTTRCQSAVADIHAFIWESKTGGLDWGRQYWGRDAQRALDAGDPNPCPTLPQYQRYGRKAFSIKAGR